MICIDCDVTTRDKVILFARKISLRYNDFRSATHAQKEFNTRSRAHHGHVPIIFGRAAEDASGGSHRATRKTRQR